DQGDCFSALEGWSEVRPSFVKIDRHFIQNIDKDPIKAKFVKSMLKKAVNTGCQVIAEGIETRAQLLMVHGLGIPFGQGYHITRPTDKPSSVVPAVVVQALSVPSAGDSVPSNEHASLVEHKLLIKQSFFLSDSLNSEVFHAFESNPQLEEVAIVKDGVPIGLISRTLMIDRFARPYRRELYGKKPCTTFMDSDPLIVDVNISLQDLSHLVASDRRYLTQGFIVTENGLYIGIGTGRDLIREITNLQIRAARYANPLTGLPGNMPINEHINKLLEQQVPFVACYFDLDHFKPFNDVYGFSKGDAMIQMTAKILAETCDPELDFLGHIGGDDFIALFCSPDWEDRCRRGLEKFGAAVIPFFSVSDNERGGYVVENRRGEKEFNALTSLSIGAVKVGPGVFSSHMEVSTVAAEAKKMAKKISGNSLYINLRSYTE
ncbi:MAG: EAL domain-containing protein, partial [Gammaproteobacteria bacterium]|nr:EAL domain-containing protein [Gammaproteobacteria bacterium]